MQLCFPSAVFLWGKKEKIFIPGNFTEACSQWLQKHWLPISTTLYSWMFISGPRSCTVFPSPFFCVLKIKIYERLRTKSRPSRFRLLKHPMLLPSGYVEFCFRIISDVLLWIMKHIGQILPSIFLVDQTQWRLIEGHVIVLWTAPWSGRMEKHLQFQIRSMLHPLQMKYSFWFHELVQWQRHTFHITSQLQKQIYSSIK